MDPTRVSSKQFFKTIQLIFGAFLFGQLIFLGISILLVIGADINIGMEEATYPLLAIIAILSINAIVTGKIMFTKRLLTAKTKTNLDEKVTDYMSGAIIRFAFFEGVSLFSIICYLLTSNWLFLAVVTLMIVIFISLRPNKEKIIAELELNYDEIANIEQ